MLKVEVALPAKASRVCASREGLFWRLAVKSANFFGDFAFKFKDLGEVPARVFIQSKLVAAFLQCVAHGQLKNFILMLALRDLSFVE
jgi:hypothetical protein